jgi:hypothetical protein
MALLALVGSVVVIDVAAKLAGHDTITRILRRNRAEAAIGVLWLAVHVLKEDR